MTLLLCIQLIVAIVCVSSLISGANNFRLMRRDWRKASGHPLPESAPMISVLIPARNEAHNIGACLESLMAQDYPNYEVILLDDQSDDGTGDVARALVGELENFTIMTGKPLEEDWVGKPHACQQLAEQARGDYLLFTDADTVFTPQALTRSLRMQQARRVDLLTGLPYLENVKFWERVTVPMLGMATTGYVIYPLIESNLLWKYSAASGAFLFFRREAYEAIGQHHCVKDRIIEDIELARAIKRQGRPLAITDVTPIIKVRMYQSFNEIWEGFTKNLHSVFPGILSVVPIFLLPAVYILPWIVLMFGPVWGLSGLQATVLPLLSIGSIMIMRSMFDHRLGTPSLMGYLLTPLGALVFTAIAVRSAWRAILREPVPWRKRTYEKWI